MDFNVNPMTAVVAQQVGDQCQIIDEIVLPNSNTQEMMQEINRKFPARAGMIYPDPSCAARKTCAAAGETDLTIIHRAGWKTQLPYKVYPLVDRINSVNAMLCNAEGVRRLLISRQCKYLIKALDALTYKEGTRIPDGSSGLDHITDALGYIVIGRFPLIENKARSYEFF
jgi:hypothetical protein